MAYHLATADILLAALSFYTLGYSILGGIAFIVGGAFELWFWMRLFRSG